jgi:cell division protease FtsH
MTSGASNDIERATDIAQHMVCEFGMSPLGPLAFRKPGNAFEADKHHTVSEATAQRVDEAIRTIVMNAYDQATGIISRNQDAVRMMAELLLEQESIEAHEIKDVLARANARV